MQHKLNNPQKFLFGISFFSFMVFGLVSVSTILGGRVEKGSSDGNVLGTISDKKLRLNYYINSDFKHPFVEEVTQGNLVSASDQNIKVELSEGSLLACRDCSFSYSDEFGLSVLSGVGYLENKGGKSLELVFEREVLSVTPNTKLIYDYKNKEVFVVSGAISNARGEIIETNQKYSFLVDKFYLRESDLKDSKSTEIRDLGYFLYDINNLPAELSYMQPEI